MKVLWLAQHPVPSTNNTHPAPWVSSLAKALSSKGVCIEILTSNSKLKTEFQEFQLDGYKLKALKSISGYLDLPLLFTNRITKMKRYLKSLEGYDAIHVHGTEFQLGTSVMEAHINAPSVISIQGVISEYKKKLPKAINYKTIAWNIFSYYEKKELKQFTNFSCRTHWDNNIVKSYNPNANIYNIWEILREEFYASPVKDLGKNILFSGGCNPLKGLSRAIKAFDMFLYNQKDAKLHIVGSCQWHHINELIKKFNLKNITQSNVYLHGMVGAVKLLEIYRDCFCLLHTSLIDNSPNSICEAQLSGLPVIATNVGGVGSLIKDEHSGFLLGETEEKDLARIMSLHSNKKLQADLSKNARQEALSRHDINTIASQTIEMYSSLKN